MAEPSAEEVGTWPAAAQAMYWKSIAQRGMMAAPFVPTVVSQPTVVLPRVSSPAENTSNVKGVVQAVRPKEGICVLGVLVHLKEGHCKGIAMPLHQGFHVYIYILYSFQ